MDKWANKKTRNLVFIRVLKKKQKKTQTKTQKICFSILYIHMEKHSNGFGSIYSSSHFGHEEPKKTNKIKEALNKAVTFISKKVKK